jgi:hypothetical protein
MYLDLYDALVRHTIDAGLAFGDVHRLHVTTASYTALMSGAPPDIRTVPVSAAAAAAPTGFFSDVRVSTFSKSTVELRTAWFPSVRVKAFNGGRVHVSGCKSQHEAETVLAETCRLVCSEGARVGPCRLAMINVAVDLGEKAGFSLTRFAGAARALRLRDAVVEIPERPPCAMISAAKRFTIMAYATGKAYVSATSLEDLAEGYGIFVGLAAGLRPRPPDPSPPKGRGGTRTKTWPRLALEISPGCMHTHPPTRRQSVRGCDYCESHGNCFATAP